MAACLRSLDHLTHLLFLAVQLYRRSALQALQEEEKMMRISNEIRRQIYYLCDTEITLQRVRLEKPRQKNAFAGQVLKPHIHNTSIRLWLKQNGTANGCRKW